MDCSAAFCRSKLRHEALHRRRTSRSAGAECGVPGARFLLLANGQTPLRSIILRAARLISPLWALCAVSAATVAAGGPLIVRPPTVPPGAIVPAALMAAGCPMDNGGVTALTVVSALRRPTQRTHRIHQKATEGVSASRRPTADIPPTQCSHRQRLHPGTDAPSTGHWQQE